MTVKQAKAHETLCHGPNFEPQVDSYAGNNAVNTLLSSQWWTGSSTRNVASLPEGLEAAEQDSEAESLHGLLDDREEGNSNAASRHREGRAFERTNDDEDENEEDNGDNDNADDNADDNDDNDNDSDNIDTTLLEDFAHFHILDTSRREGL